MEEYLQRRSKGMNEKLILVGAIFSGLFTFSFFLAFIIPLISAHKENSKELNNYMKCSFLDILTNLEIFKLAHFVKQLPGMFVSAKDEWKKNKAVKTFLVFTLISLMCFVFFLSKL